MKGKVISGFVLWLGILLYVALPGENHVASEDFFYNGVIVTFKEGVYSDAAESIAESMSLRVKCNFENISRLKGKVIMSLETKNSESVYRLLRELASHPGVLEVAPDYRVWATGEPNDSLFHLQWGLHNTGQTGGVADIDVDAPEAWGNYTGSKGVFVAVIDSGIDYNHPDLAGNIWENPGETAGNGIDDDGNGYVDDIHGINAITGSGNPMDDSGHGSHCAGIIGALSDNSLGISGINWRVRLLGAKFLNSFDLGRLSHVIECVDYIIAMRLVYGQNIVAINASYAHNGFVQAEKDAIEAAGELGIVFCAAAGNNGVDDDVYPVYPASYDSPSIISVTAVDHNGTLHYNYGIKGVDLAAPGVGITGTVSHYKPGAGDVVFDDMESGRHSAWVTGGTLPWKITREEDRTLINPDLLMPSPPHFWADSPGVYYSNNSDSWLEWGKDIDLSKYTKQDVRIGFWAAYFLEPGKDGCSLDFSRDRGGTWTSVADFGDLPEASFWDFFNFLIPDTFKTATFRFRFHLYSNDSFEYAGFNFDNIGVGTTADFAYEPLSGTSMAAPHVAGAVALLAGQYPADTVQQRKSRILDNVTPLDSLTGKCVSGGMLNLNMALGNPKEPVIRVLTPGGGESFSWGQNITASWDASGISGDVTLVLYKVEGSGKFIIGTIPWDSTPYSFDLPMVLTSGFYFLRISQAQLKGDSGVFLITSSVPSIIVTAPQGGTFFSGAPITVDWLSSGVTGTVSVILMKTKGTEEYELDQAAPYNDLPRFYNIPQGLSPGEYFIRVKNNFVWGDSPTITISR